MRNEPKPLDRQAAAHAYRVRDALTVGAFVTLRYVKRDGTESSSAGEVAYFNGKEGYDTMSVTVNDAQKGPRTINLCRVTAVVPL